LKIPSVSKASEKDLRRMPKPLRRKVRAFDPCWGREEWQAVCRFLLGEQFEDAARRLAERLSEATGWFAVPTFGGRDAIRLAASTLGLSAGEEVLCPSFTCPASVAPLIRHGCAPVFVDIGRDLCIDPDQVEACIGDKARAILVVNQFGIVAQMGRIQRIARKHNLRIIDDSAQTFFGAPGGGPGTLGDAGILSFNFGKPVSSVGGGALLLPEASAAKLPGAPRRRVLSKVAEVVSKQTRFQGIGRSISIYRRIFRYARGDGDGHSPSVAAVQRMAGIQAEVALHRLDKSLGEYAIRQENRRILEEELEGVDNLELPHLGLQSACVFLPLLLLRGHRLDLARLLARKGFETTWDYYPLHMQPEMRKYRHGPMTRTESVWRRIVILPLHARITEDQCFEMARLIARWARMS